ncbi:Fic family protein [Hydrogenimonas thermophila]|uniref:Fic/DOC family protein n=1 Tax=Hydrogenimonas thermophila TaxID=223786 RepID=A0A1I5SSJ4_9BACT|nr:Fic family protein [Hydrogenimonas thermophila]SFP73730.1 Fic/DOC family protein [Hydrogenimonas thermophila]
MKYSAEGYEAIIQKYNLNVIPNWHRSFIWKESQTHHKQKSNDYIKEIFPAKYKPGKSIGEQLEFAFKYDGINLSILSQIFSVIDTNDLIEYIKSKRTGKYARRIWFLYEFLTGKKLPIDDLKQGNYIDLLEVDQYYTLSKGTSVKRQRVRNNLLGTKAFCPIVRKTETLKNMENEDLAQVCKELIVNYPPEILRKALAYLYTKETKSSFFIEHEEPNNTRTERFVALLQEAQEDDFCQKERLIELQNRIVDKRFADKDYRKNQNYVGETLLHGREKIHYISPKPKELEELMEGLILCHHRMIEGNVNPIIHASVIAYGFVFLHPFEDGNGRIHRFLIHNILAIRGFTPRGIMFPVSAVMLKKSLSYDQSLEAFSSKLIPLIDYTLDEDGIMKVSSDTAHWYRYMDLTQQSEALYSFVKETIENELPNELLFLSAYNKTKEAMKEIIDMPDRMIDLFIRFTLQNHGKLSKKKRYKYFDKLTDQEIEKLQKVLIDQNLHHFHTK